MSAERFAVAIARRLQIFPASCEHYVPAGRFPHIRLRRKQIMFARTLDPAAKTCNTPEHDGFGNHLLHYYRELT
ncbi:MAG: hypothetical protein ACLFPA_08435 [Dichotomicrobium sp.]